MVSSRTLRIVLLAAATLAACKSSSTGPTLTNPTGSYKGTLVNATVSGVLTVTFPAAATAPASAPVASGIAYSAMSADAITVTATLTIAGGSPVNFSGTYDATAATPLNLLAAGGWTITGSWSSTANSISGNFSGPSGTGSWTASGGTGAKVFCGTYGTGTATSGDGTWNLVWDGAVSLVGVASTSGADLALQGSLTGSTVNVTFTGGNASGNLTTSNGTGTGPWMKGTANGHWATSACP